MTETTMTIAQFLNRIGYTHERPEGISRDRWRAILLHYYSNSHPICPEIIAS